MIGRTFAHYKIAELIGKGGMGEVYRARDQRLDRDVALKFLSKGGSDDAQRVRRFEREAKALASLEHPNIATVYGFHDEEGLLFIAMELISGSTIEADITEKGLALDRLLVIGIPLAEAISFAHARGVIHRDLKPANVMWDASGRIQVLDFGLAALRHVPPETDPDATWDMLTTAGEIMGTVHYMAPEQVEGRTVDERADVFALGVILYELATGQRPFVANSTAGVASAILRDDPASLRELRPDLPADLARVVRRCLEKKVDKRMQTVRDIHNELEDIRAGIRTGDSTSSPVQSEGSNSPVERRMTITTEHVRQLSTRIPRMVGDCMTYLDNGRRSDVLVVCLHGIGTDQRDFEDVLRHISYRAVSFSLFGFGPAAQMRAPLSYADHNRLAGFLIEAIHQRIAPQVLVIVGQSSGADQCMQIVASPVGERLHPDGLLLLGPSVIPGEGRMSGPYSRLTGDPADILDLLRTMSARAQDLADWVIMHDYLLRAFGKLETDTTALQEFARTYIIASEDEGTFFRMFRTAVERTRHLRCIFGTDDTADSDLALERHLSDNALGDGYSEEMIANVPVPHIGLKRASVVLPLVDELVHLSGKASDPGGR